MSRADSSKSSHSLRIQIFLEMAVQIEQSEQMGKLEFITCLH